MLEWMFWEQYSHEPYIAVRIARLHYLKTPEQDLDPKLLTRGNDALARMELQLKETPFLVGDAVSLADIALVAYTRKARMGGYALADYPAVVKWITRVEAALKLPPIDARM
jgi:glutathione S-transferase